MTGNIAEGGALNRGLLFNVGRLTALLQTITPLLRVQLERQASTMCPKSLARCFSEIRNPIQKMRSSGAMVNPWILAGLERKEVRNAAVLAGLWNPALAGDAAIIFLNAFFRQVEAVNGVRLPDFASLSRGYTILTEDCAVGQVTERIDLTIEGPDYLIGMEIKIEAVEGSAQLQRYQTALAARAKSRGSTVEGLKPYLIFLAARQPSISNVSLASWRDVAHSARASAEGMPSFFASLLVTFADHVEQF